MIIFRPATHLLEDAMKEAREFNTEEEMKEYIVKQRDNAFSIEDIVIEDRISFDSRIGWEDTRYVCTKRYGEEIFSCPQCIGMCATKYIK
jgi:hypothetical protein